MYLQKFTSENNLKKQIAAACNQLTTNLKMLQKI